GHIFAYSAFSDSSTIRWRKFRGAGHLPSGITFGRVPRYPYAEIDPPPPPKMTQGVMTPLTPLHHLQQHPRAGSQGVGVATLIFWDFLRYFSSTHRTTL